MARKQQAPSFMEQQAAAIGARADAEMKMLDINQQARDAAAMAPKKINSKEVLEAAETLRKYKEGKARLEQKIIANEQYWKLRQWSYYNKDIESMNNKDAEFEPATAWLWKMIQSRYSDAMDSYPTCNFRPRQEDDKAEAKKLSSIVPIVLEQNRYEETYSDIVWYMLKQGAAVQAILWDSSKHNGLGDIAVKKLDILNIFWEPGVTNIQDSDNVFVVELVNNKVLEQMYPQTVGKLGGEKINVAKYLYDDRVDTSSKSYVVDWYYHTYYNGRKALQLVKFVNDIVLYATENETEIKTRTVMDPITNIPQIIPIENEPMAVKGLYDHALYPFVVQDLYPIEGSICGYGLTDIGRDTQQQIDILNKAVTDNAVVTATPRYFVKNDGTVNEKEYANLKNKFIHVEGSVDDTKIRPVDISGLSTACIEELQMKIDELKYITSNQDVANGSAPAGITAASAIAALQETAGKDARSSNMAFHRMYREVCYQIVELIRQFYDTPRTFRIVPDSFGEQFITYSNANLKPQQQLLNGAVTGFRLPEFDIEVSSEKASTYKKIEQNELALNFYNQGFFNPQMADQALACLEMMDFSHKDEIIQRIQANGTMQQLLLQFQQIALQLAQRIGDQALVEQLSRAVLQTAGQTIPEGREISLEAAGTEEHPYVEKARAQAAESTQTD